MFVKIPNYFINLDGTVGYKEEQFRLINTKYIIAVSYIFKKFSKIYVHYIIVNTVDGKKFEFEFLDKNEVSEYIQMLTERTEMVIE